MKFLFNSNTEQVDQTVKDSIVPIENLELDNVCVEEDEEDVLDFNKTLAFLSGDFTIRQLLASVRKIDITAKLTTYGNDSDCSITLNYLGYEKQIDSYTDDVDNVRYIVTDYDKVSYDLFCLVLGYANGSGELVKNLADDKNTVKVIMITNQEQLRQLMASSSKKGGAGVERKK